MRIWFKRMPFSIRSLLATGVLVVMAIIGLTVNEIRLGHASAQHEAELRLAAAAFSLSEQVRRDIQAVGMIMEDARKLATGLDLSRSGIDVKLYPQLRSLARGLPILNNLLVISPEGMVVASNLVLKQKLVNTADRAYFRYHRDNPDSGIHVGESNMSRTTGVRVLQITQRINKADGSFGGIILASLRHEYLASVLQGFVPDDGGAAAMLHLDGKMLARYPVPDDKIFEHDFSEAPLLVNVRRLGSSGVYWNKAAIVDGGVRMFAYRTVGELPVVINVSQIESAIFSAWHGLVQRQLVMAAMTIISLILLLAFLIRQLARQEENAQRFRQLFEQVPNIAVQGYNTRREVIYWNPASERLYGYRSAEAIGRKREDLLMPSPMREALIGAINDWLSGGAAIPAGELTLQRKDGSSVTVFSSHAMLVNPRNEPEIYSVDVELTELKKTEAELRAYQAHLEEMVAARTAALAVAKDAAEAANRAKSTFLANMSHELRTPMHGVMGMINIARRRMSDPQGLEQLDKAKQAADHLMSVINDILDLSKIEAEHLVLDHVPLKLADVLLRSTQLLENRVAEKNLVLQVDMPLEIAAIRYLGDPLRLGQVLLNLVGNAIKFTPAGHIAVRCRALEDHPSHTLLRFEIEDTGIGIAPAEQERLFNAFVQADGSMARKYGGSGLGLAISKRLVLKMAGEIGVNSIPGQGSIFWFTIRLDKQRNEGESPAAPEPINAGPI